MSNLLWSDGYGYVYCAKNNLVTHAPVIVKTIINTLLNTLTNLASSDNNWEHAFWKTFNMFYFHFDIVISILRTLRRVNSEKGVVICILPILIE